MNLKVRLPIPVMREKGNGVEWHQLNMSRCRFRITARLQVKPGPFL